MSEETTQVVTMDLSSTGRDWVWYDDLRIVALDVSLDEAGRDRALSEIHQLWRRKCLEAIAQVA